eukprot:4310427-Pyramimonas_sp.AAC.2
MRSFDPKRNSDAATSGAALCRYIAHYYRQGAHQAVEAPRGWEDGSPTIYYCAVVTIPTDPNILMARPSQEGCCTNGTTGPNSL